MKNTSSPIVAVQVKYSHPENKGLRSLAFTDEYAGSKRLYSRVTGLVLAATDGTRAVWREVPGGNVFADMPFNRFRYKVEAGAPADARATSRISWIDEKSGLLMLNDLLPEFGARDLPARVSLELPASWRVATAVKRERDGTYLVSDPANAVFFVGKGFRREIFRIDRVPFEFALSGNWKFSDPQAFSMAESIANEYRKLFGRVPKGKVQIVLRPLPADGGNVRWSAETRGSTVVIVSSPARYGNLGPQRLHEQLRHEILHLWIPNGLGLTGDYAWFYEGFSVYLALKTGVRMGRIRFDDLLYTVGRAFDLTTARNQQVPLVEMAKDRWSKRGGGIYEKGLLTAFLTDVELLRSSKGRKDLDGIFKTLYRRFRRTPGGEDGTPAILGILAAHPELNGIVARYVKGRAGMRWGSYLGSIGVEDRGHGGRSKLVVSDKLNRRQKTLLDRLGYNSWRKLSRER